MISFAHAAGPAGAPGLTDFLPLVIIFILFWFMLIRPQMKRAKEQKKLISELAKGDEVITTSGQLGKISKISDQYVSLEIAEGVVTLVQKSSVQTLLPKGTIKTL
jgi:protein translocase subunit yajC